VAQLIEIENHPQQPPSPPETASVKLFHIMSSNISLDCSLQARDCLTNKIPKYQTPHPPLPIPPLTLMSACENLDGKLYGQLLRKQLLHIFMVVLIDIDFHPQTTPPPPNFFKCYRPTYIILLHLTSTWLLVKTNSKTSTPFGVKKNQNIHPRIPKTV
jgi:hypothetical protein